MSPHALDRPDEIYRPFTKGETATIRAFVTDVRRLGSMRFFEQVPKSATLTFDGEGATQSMVEPDDEDLRAAITQFRQIYSHKEPTSFKATFNLLKKSVHQHNGPLRDEAMFELDSHLEAERKVLREGIGVGIVFEDGDKRQEMDARKIIDAYLHGQYLHSGNNLADLVRRLDDTGPFARMTFYSVLLSLRNVFWIAANAAERVLRKPELLDSDAQPTAPQI